jgi:hypothetical protein
VICEAKRMPSLRSKRETREMQAVGQILTLSRLTSFPACLAAGPACVLMRPRLGGICRTDCPAAPKPAPEYPGGSRSTELVAGRTRPRGDGTLHPAHVSALRNETSKRRGRGSFPPERRDTSFIAGGRKARPYACRPSSRFRAGGRCPACTLFGIRRDLGKDILEDGKPQMGVLDRLRR